MYFGNEHLGRACEGPENNSILWYKHVKFASGKYVSILNYLYHQDQEWKEIYYVLLDVDDPQSFCLASQSLICRQTLSTFTLFLLPMIYINDKYNRGVLTWCWSKN